MCEIKKGEFDAGINSIRELFEEKHNSNVQMLKIVRGELPKLAEIIKESKDEMKQYRATIHELFEKMDARVTPLETFKSNVKSNVTLLGTLFAIIIGSFVFIFPTYIEGVIRAENKRLSIEVKKEVLSKREMMDAFDEYGIKKEKS